MANENHSDLTDEENMLLTKAWPSGVPETEVRLLRATRPDRRKDVMQRMEVLLDLEEFARTYAGKQPGFAERAATLNMGRTGLMKLRKAWDNCRSLASITPFASLASPEQYSEAIRYAGGTVERTIRSAKVKPVKKPANSTKRRYHRQIDASDEIRTFVQAALARNSKASNGVLGRMVIETFPDAGMSKPTAVALVQRLRLERDAQPNSLREAFGKSVLVDVCALDLFIEESGETPNNADQSEDGGTIAMLGIVMETASRSILGWAVGPSASVELQLLAIEAFTGSEGSQILAEGGRSGPAVEVLFVPGPHSALAEDTVLMQKLSSVVTMPRLGPRRYGRRLTSLVGARIGRLGLRPAATPLEAERQILRWSPVVRTWKDAEIFVGSAIKRHMRDVEEQICALEPELLQERRARIWQVLQKVHDILT